MPLTWNETRNRWEGDADAGTSGIVVAVYGDLPDPRTVEIGTTAVVQKDPFDPLNGLHVALGNYWQRS